MIVAVPLLDMGTEFGARAARRLQEDMTAWLTSTDRAGTPQPAPVWFLWNDDDSSVLVYSQPGARRLSRIGASPRGSLHLNDAGEGHDFVVLTGTIEQAPGLPPAHEHPLYTVKYADWMVRVFGSAERFSSMFSVPLLFRASRIRGG
jgi:PPOX class probable F420-dependent enzyme